MKRLLAVMVVLVVTLAGTAWAQTPAASDRGLEDKLNQKLDNLANTKYDFMQAEILFKVLELKHTIDFDVLGSNKGFNRRLSRVTAKLTNIRVCEPGKVPLAEKYLQANAAELDMNVKYRSTIANGYFSSGDSMFPETIKAFLDAYKANKAGTFKGSVMIRVATAPGGAPTIDKVQLVSVQPNAGQ